MPSGPIKGWRQLAFRPVRVPLPQATDSITHKVRYVEGCEPHHILLIKAQELPARGKIVIHDIEDLSVDSGVHSCEHDSFGAVINVGEGNWVRPAQMQKHSETIDPHSSSDCRFSRAINRTGSHDHVREAKPARLLDHEVVLLYLCVAI